MKKKRSAAYNEFVSMFNVDVEQEPVDEVLTNLMEREEVKMSKDFCCQKCGGSGFSAYVAVPQMVHFTVVLNEDGTIAIGECFEDAGCGADEKGAVIDDIFCDGCGEIVKEVVAGIEEREEVMYCKENKNQFMRGCNNE